MREIGGYLELDTYHLPMLHEDAVALNCGRNALAYLFQSRNIRKIKLPYFICGSIYNVCDREGVEKSFYHIGLDFHPAAELTLEDDEWLYLINFYGQLSNEEISGYVRRYERVIVDQANAYFQAPLPHVDTIYCCRKNFGVADGAFLYTDRRLQEETFPLDESFERVHYLLGRYERGANAFYQEYNANNKFFADEPIKRMSKLTQNLLHAIDYPAAERRRSENFAHLHARLSGVNLLSPKPGTFMYPLLLENGSDVRRSLQEKKIYVPTLWPTVLEITEPQDTEYNLAKNILPLPIDQRYGMDDMDYMVETIMGVL